MTQTNQMREIDLGMSNFDHEIDLGFVEALQAEPAQVFGYHAAWNFIGKVWFENGHFHEEVWRYRSLVKVFHADTLGELMSDVNSKWGSD